MTRIYSPSVFLREKKLRNISLEPELFDRFKKALLLNLPLLPDDDPESNYSDSVKALLNDTFYKGKNKIAQRKGVKTDFNIFEDNTTSSSPVVLVEMKSPSEKNEMLTKEDLNRKALHELILYYLTELEGPGHNNAIRILIASNGYDWFIFEETLFRRLFATKKFIQEYRKVNPEAPTFYKEKTKEFYAYIAKEIEKEGLTEDMSYIYFSLKGWDKMSDRNLSDICKVLSPYFLLGKPARDANDMNDAFYRELLYIIGLEERKEKGNVTIQRPPEQRREDGSLLESTLSWLVAHDELSEEEKYDAALELVLTWVNRLLFIKLVESQIISFNSWEEKDSHGFFNEDKIKSFRNIDDLFFKVLALPEENRDKDVRKQFAEVPYLNSKLFECTYLERHLNTKISFLKVIKMRPYKDTVITYAGRKIQDPLDNISYLIAFLSRYNFGEARKDDTRELINASVLGKIFEKINGYKDGAVFTPASITNFICKETLERVVIDKLNAWLGCRCQTLLELRAQIPSDELRRASDTINELRVCDPAVGSGHFLVSALNRLLAIKAELGVLLDENNQPLTLNYNISVSEADELEVKRGSQHFAYKKDVDDLTRIQKALFHEKAAIIGHCLFGVDINPKSVDICQLRLWIELLKNAYYDGDRLVTLPNIDINIKQGDSLLHSLPLDADIMPILRKKYFSIRTYKEVNTNYKTAVKPIRKEYDHILKSIQQELLSYIAKNNRDRLYRRREKLSAKLSDLGFIGYVNPLFHHEDINDEDVQKQVEKIAANLEKINAQIRDREKIYANAFEWRYMFPDVLADDGTFEGFDCIIGNPPYIQLQKMGGVVDEYSRQGYESFARTGDLSVLFYEWCMSLLRRGGYLTFITTNSWMRADYGKNLQRVFERSDVNPMMLIDFFTFQVFKEVTIRTNILMLQKAENRNRLMTCTVKDNKTFKLKDLGKFYHEEKKEYSFIGRTPWVFRDEEKEKVKAFVCSQGKALSDDSWNLKINRGVPTGLNDAFWINHCQYKSILEQDPKSAEIIKPLLRGRHIDTYKYEWNELYLICTFPSRKYDIDDFPAIKRHLLSYAKDKLIEKGYQWVANDYLEEFCYKKLEQTGSEIIINGEKIYFSASQSEKARKRTDNKWFETQDTIGFYTDFNQRKIIYPNQTTHLSFYLDTEGYFINQKAYMIVGKHLGYLTAFFNSALFRYCFTDEFPLIQGAGREMNKSIFERIPVKDVTDEENAEYERRVMEIQQMKREGLPTDEKEQELDLMILAHYGIADPELQQRIVCNQT